MTKLIKTLMGHIYSGVVYEEIDLKARNALLLVTFLIIGLLPLSVSASTPENHHVPRLYPGTIDYAEIKSDATMSHPKNFYAAVDFDVCERLAPDEREKENKSVEK